MDKEAILDKCISCTCNEGYKIRNLADPDCPRHSWDEEIKSAMESYSTSLRKENEELKNRSKLKDAVNIEFRLKIEKLEATIIEKNKEIAELKEIIEYKTKLYEGKYYDATTYVAKTFPDKDIHDQILIADGIVEANYKIESQIAEQQKTIDYWKQRCEAAESLIETVNSNGGTISYDVEAKLKWQELKNEII